MIKKNKYRKINKEVERRKRPNKKIIQLIHRFFVTSLFLSIKQVNLRYTKKRKEKKKYDTLEKKKNHKYIRN